MSPYESDLDFKVLLDNLNDCVGVVADDFRLLYVNRKMIALSGYGEDELEGMPIVELIHPDKRMKVEDFLKKRFSGIPVPDRYETVIVSKDGAPLLVEFSATVVTCGDQSVDIIVFHDISDRKRIQDALHASDDHYQFIVENLPVVIWMSDRAGNTLYISENVSNIYGYSPQEIYEHGDELWFERIHPDDRELVVTSFQNMLDSDRAYDIEYRIQHKDGQWIWLHDRALSKIDKTGVRYAYGIFTDITDRRKMEISLADQHRKFNAIISHSFQFTGLLQPDGTMIEVNNTALAFKGIKRTDVIGKPFWETPWWNHSQDAQWKVRTAVEKAANGLTSQFETTHIDSDNNEHIIDVSMRPVFDEERNVIFIVPEGRVITDFITTQNELYKAKALLTAALDQSPSGILIADAPDVNISFVNRAALEIYGEKDLDPEQIPSALHPMNLRIFHTDGSGFEPEELPLTQAIRRGNTTRNFEAIIRRPDGEDRWTLANASPIRNQENEVIGGIIIFTDITEQKLGEEILRESEERFSIAFKSSPAPMVISEIESGVFLDVNNRWIEMLEWTHDEQIGRTSREVGIWDDPADRDRIIEKLHHNGHFRDEPIRFRSKSGRIIDALWSGEAISLSGKEVMLSLITDITELKQAQEALRESQDRLIQALEAGGLGSWSYYTETNTLKIDQRSMDLIRHVPEEQYEYITLEEWNSHIHPDDRQGAIEMQQRILSGEEQLYDHEYRYCVSEDNYVWFQARGKVVEQTADGKPLQVTGVSIDISERKKAEQERDELESQLRQAQKMEAIGTLAGGIAHDFNNILTVIIGNLDFLRFIRQEQELEVENPILDSLQAAHRARDLVSQILTFSRKTDVDKLPLDIGPICKETLKLLRSSTPSTIDIKQHIHSNLPRVVADPTLIHQIVMNLCTNAVHAMNDQPGTITVTLESCQTQCSATEKKTRLADSCLCLKISDTGTGIPENTLDKIFLPYYTTKPQGEGTGLGLAVVHGIVKDLGGEITVNSVFGEGTTFTVTLPALDQEVAPEIKQKKDIPTGTGRILVVDDEPQIVRILEKILAKLGYESVLANDGERALSILAEQTDRIDLIITDYTMPKKTGIELTPEFKRIRKNIPVVLITGLQTPLIEAKAQQAGVDVIVNKPPSIKSIADAVKQCLVK